MRLFDDMPQSTLAWSLQVAIDKADTKHISALFEQHPKVDFNSLQIAKSKNALLYAVRMSQAQINNDVVLHLLNSTRFDVTQKIIDIGLPSGKVNFCELLKSLFLYIGNLSEGAKKKINELINLVEKHQSELNQVRSSL